MFSFSIESNIGCIVHFGNWPWRKHKLSLLSLKGITIIEKLIFKSENHSKEHLRSLVYIGSGQIMNLFLLNRNITKDE